MEFIHYDLEKTFIFGMKANRLIALSERERKDDPRSNTDRAERRFHPKVLVSTETPTPPEKSFELFLMLRREWRTPILRRFQRCRVPSMKC
jgi:hypothetical protein